MGTVLSLISVHRTAGTGRPPEAMNGRLSGTKRVEPRHVCRTAPENGEWQLRVESKQSRRRSNRQIADVQVVDAQCPGSRSGCPAAHPSRQVDECQSRCGRRALWSRRSRCGEAAPRALTSGVSSAFHAARRREREEATLPVLHWKIHAAYPARSLIGSLLPARNREPPKTGPPGPVLHVGPTLLPTIFASRGRPIAAAATSRSVTPAGQRARSRARERTSRITKVSPLTISP